MPLKDAKISNRRGEKVKCTIGLVNQCTDVSLDVKAANHEHEDENGNLFLPEINKRQRFVVFIPD